MAVFEAYGSLCGDAGIGALDAMLNGKSMFGRREDAELRACAAVALGRIGSADARASLQKAAAEKDVVVRNAVGRALRGATT
jgi:HEAT repeat protein